MADLKSLKVKRGQFKTQLKRFQNFIEANSDDDGYEINERLNRFAEVLEKFYNIQHVIREKRKTTMQKGETAEQVAERVNAEEDEIEVEFEDSYYRLVAVAKRKLEERCPTRRDSRNKYKNSPETRREITDYRITDI